MSRVVVTGGSGFVGLPLIIGLMRAGAEVHALSRAHPPPEVAGVHWHRLDIADGAAVEALMEEVRPERLVHLAWYVEHGRFWDAPENVAWVERSLRLIRAFANTGGRRAVMLGTCAEYDWSLAEMPLSERSSPLAPTTLYGVTKDALHRVAKGYFEREKVELAWGRLFFLYGPREAPGRLVSSVIRALLAGDQVKTSSGTQRRDFLHVDDVARAVIELLDSTVVGSVNIASGEAVPTAEVVGQIARVIGRPELVLSGARSDAPGEPPLLVADVARLRDEVGFRPEISLMAGIESTVSWWRAAGPGPLR